MWQNRLAQIVKTKLSFMKNLQIILQTFVLKLLQSDQIYGKIIPVERAESALTAKDMRGSGRLLAVCQGISVEYVRFQTGRMGY